MRLFVNCHPVVIDDLAGRGDRKARLDLGTDVFQPQYTIIFTIDPEASAITGNCRLLDRSAFAPTERLMRVLSLHFVFINDRAASTQRVGVHGGELRAALRFEEFSEGGHVFARRDRAAKLQVVVLIFSHGQAVNRKQFVILAGALTIAHCDTQAIVRHPIPALPERARSRDLLLDQIVRHLLSRAHRRFTCLLEQLCRLSDWR